MILFHFSGIDSGDLRPWRRAILPAHLLRRAGTDARVIAGDVAQSALARATTIVLAGALDQTSVAIGLRAHEAGIRVILDLADTRSLTTEADAARRLAQVAHAIVAGSGELAALATAALAPRGACRVIADVPPMGFVGPAMMFPGVGLRLAVDAVRLRLIDAVRRLRRRLRGRPTSPAAAGLRIVWFGDGAELSQEGGIGELLLAASHLTDLSEELQFRLRVIGTSRRLFRRTIGRLPIQAEFRRLTIPTLAHDLRGADLCFLPGGGDPISRARTTARADMARSLGIPVLTTGHAGLQAQPGLTLVGDWLPSLRSFPAASAPLLVPSITTDHAELAATWESIAAEEANVAKVHPVAGSKQPDRLRVLFLLQQFQDLDLICPVAEAACLHDGFDVHVAILTKIAVPAGRRLRILRERGATVTFWRARDLIDGAVRISPGDFDAAVTASDGPGPGARYAAAFVRAANAAGIATLNIQHGLDNTGLTYGPPGASFNARLILTWGGFDRLSEAADELTRAKIVPVGCPKRRLTRADAADFPLAGQPFIAVFENLHWRRYSAAYRQHFVQDLIDAASAAPDLVFVLKPHMGGRWFTREHAERPLPPNLLVADPGTHQWRRFAADSFLAHATAVITTPSTIALDAARYDLPTALVAYGISAENYEPLFRIEGAGDWHTFVGKVREGGHSMAAVRHFLATAALPGDAVARILTVIRLAAEDRTQPEILAATGHQALVARA